MRITIDRIEGDLAVVEFGNATTANAPLCLFPCAKEGDVYRITKDENEMLERRIRERELFDELEENNK